MGKGCKRKTRWRTLNIGDPPGDKDEEDGKRMDSAGSTTKDYPSNYASVVSRSRRRDSGNSSAKPKLLFNEEEYTRITAPRQDVLFKKGYLSRKKQWASMASMSATSSTTESQSASHSTADGSETTEDHHLLDCRENGVEEYPTMVEQPPQVAYGTFYDHASGYCYEYPVMVVGPAPVLPGQSPMHNVLTDVPCGPVPLRPIEWINPAFVPEHGNEQYCVVDYQVTYGRCYDSIRTTTSSVSSSTTSSSTTPTAQLDQYPTLVDEKGVPLTAQTDVTDGNDKVYYENGGTESASWAGSVADEEQSGDIVEQSQNGTLETSMPEMENIAEASVDSETYLETALAQQLHVSNVAVPPMPEPYVYPGYYMFGPSLMNVNGVTIQCGPMVRHADHPWGGTYSKAYGRQKKKKKLFRKTWAQSAVPGETKQEKQEEEQWSNNAEPVAGQEQLGSISEAGPAGIATVEQTSKESCSTSSRGQPLDPECGEFRPTIRSRPVANNNEARSLSEPVANHETPAIAASSVETTELNERRASILETEERRESTSETKEPSVSRSSDENDRCETKNTRKKRETTPRWVASSNVVFTEELSAKKSEKIVATPVDFAAEVFANVSIMAKRARGVLVGTPVETEIGLEATHVNFQEIENTRANVQVTSLRQSDDTISDRRRNEDCMKQRNVPNRVDEHRSSCERTPTSDSATVPLAVASCTTSENRQRSTTINDKRGSRSASPGMINRTTTPINANSHRLPDSYESLVTRGGFVASSLPCVDTVGTAQQACNRKYSANRPKFVRSATPGPDLDDVQSQIVNGKTVDEKTLRNNKSENGDGEAMMRILRDEMADEGSDGEIVHTGIEALEGESERYNMETIDGSSGGFNRADASNDDSGVESQTRLSLEHPIIDAVIEWLRSSSSETVFVTSVPGSDCEPEDDELEKDEPPKNLQGNPIPALSAKNTDVNNDELSRTAGFGKFANGKMDEEVNATRSNDTTSATPRRKKRGNGGKRGGRKNVKKIAPSVITSAMVDVDADAGRQRLSMNNESDAIPRDKRVDDICEITESDSVAGMRVAKSSRTKRNGTSTMMESCEGRAIAEQTRTNVTCDRTKRKKKKVVGSSDRELPIENVEVKVRRTTGEEMNDEGIVEDEEVNVRTFEKGQIVVSIEGKVLPIDNYEPILLRSNDPETNVIDIIDDRPKFSMTTCEKSRMVETNEDETSASGSVSKRNSLGSIEEPDVLECWEVETVEPVTTPKKIQNRGTSLEGEAAEDDLGTTSKIDPAGMEIVRKYYRLEATGDSGTSVTSIEDNNVDDPTDLTISKIPNQMIESVCSVEIPVLNERMNNLFDRSGIPIDEAIEAYESCYVGKRPPSYLIGNDAKFLNGSLLYGRDREGAVPCRANCCNIQ